ncbi:E2F-associated phosphoprotein isoform X1 [Carcharodon carcharias]|uniref:E2F-associated phosphoprotein isoform X1 n=1 Tax=Carcharodon carcharias TaxID=13397 RepID=UPI001B7E4E61|nr:E2F-associated phosphoprotein isoform X1 [Carcharodon carcharias]
MNCQEQDDPYLVEEPSDQEDLSSSSEDELEVLLHGTPERKRKLIKEYLTGESESSNDEFEKEMAAELDSTMKVIEHSWTLAPEGASSSIESCHTQPVPGPQYYDEVYFDSDSEAEDEQNDCFGAKEISQPSLLLQFKNEFNDTWTAPLNIALILAEECDSKKKRKKRQKVLTNDELLYDPDQDDRDQAWVDRQRRGYRGLNNRSNQSKTAPVPTSDAVLNCPACMTTLCLDCQRHELYKEQYRAMFVMNCIINRGEVLKYKEPANQKRRNRYKRVKGPTELTASPQDGEKEELYYPVRCAECSVEVAVFDKDEVYHFFNVLASHC